MADSAFAVNRDFPDLCTRTLDAASFAIVYLDADLVCRYANPAVSTFGIAHDVAVGASIDHIAGHERLVQILDEVLETGTGASSFIYAETPLGKKRLLVSAHPDRRDASGIVGVLVTAVDLTDVTSAEGESAESDVRLQEVLDAAPSAIYMKDTEGRYTLVNAQFEELCGLTRQQMIGRKDGELFPQDVAVVFESADELVLKKGARHSAEKRIHVAGKVHSMACRKSPLRDEQGRVTGLLCIATDVSEFERAQRLVASSNRRLAGIIDSIREAFFALDRDGRFTWLNERAVSLLGRPATELYSLSLFDLPGHPVGVGCVERCKRVLETGEAVVFEQYHDETGTWLEVRAYPTEDGMSAYLADITERKRHDELDARLLRAYEAELERTLLLKDVAAASASATSVQEACDAALKAAAERIDVRMGVVFAVAEEARELRELATFGMPAEVPKPLVVPLESATDIAALIRDDLPLITDADAPVGDSGAFLAQAGLADHRFAALPIRIRDRTIGLLGVAFASRIPFSPEELSLFQGIAEQLGVTIENARLFESQSRALEAADLELTTSRLLLEAAQALSSSLERQDVLEALMEIVRRSTGRRRASIAFRDGAETLRVVASVGERHEVGDMLLLDEVPEEYRDVLTSGRSLVVDTEMLDPARCASFLDGGERSLMLLQPLVFGDRVLGIMSVDDAGDIREFSNRERQLIAGIAAQAAVAIENARLYEEQRETAALREAVARIDLVIHSSLDFEEVLAQVVHLAREALECERAIISERVGEGWAMRHSSGFEEPPDGRVVTDEQAAYTVRAMHARRAVTFHEQPRSGETQSKLGDEYGIRSQLIAPIISRGETTGALFFGYVSRCVPFGQPHIDFAERVAASLSIALENARLYEQEHKVAETLQQSILNISRDVKGIDVGHFYHSATEHARVGGDFYDVFPLRGSQVAIVIGDVSGKGLDASYMTALVKNALRTHAVEGYLPSVVMRKTNETVKHFSAPEVFVTAFFGVLDTRTGVLTYCSAGHPPAMALRDDSVERLEGGDPLLGAFAGLDYHDHLSRMSPNDMLVLYTDGVTESRRSGELYGERRLAEFLDTLRGSSAKTVAEDLFHEVWAYSEGSLRDDVAMLAVRLRPRAGRQPGLSNQPSLPLQ